MKRRSRRRYAAVRSVAFAGVIADLTGNEARVLLYLWAAADNAAGEVRAGYSLIAGATGMHRTSVRRGLDGLVEKGIVEQVLPGHRAEDERFGGF